MVHRELLGVRRPVSRLSLLALSAVVLAGLPAHAASRPGVAPLELPDGVPGAALQAEPALPRAAGWAADEAFPRTSGTARLRDGAVYWTDFLLDDSGAAGVRTGRSLSALAPTTGTYTYPAGPAAGNGADVFRAAVALERDATVWRVDWRTLVDPAVPAAVWALDLDGRAATGTSAWPGVPGLSSPGLEAALVVTSRGARLVDTRTGGVRALPVRVDRAARSFVVRVPRRVLPVSGTSEVRLAAGLAGEDGLAPVPVSRGALPGQPPVHDLGLVAHAVEPADGSDWRDAAQARALAAGEALPGLRVDWRALAARRATGEPRVTGLSDRWFATTTRTGEGALPAEGVDPVYRGLLQPYTVFVPPARGPRPVTLLLHSTGSSHRQYAAGNPRLVAQLCAQRASVCVMPLAHGPAGNYLRTAEVDVWRAWREAAQAFALDSERTVVAGYSLGGYGAYRLGLTYPDVFAQALVLAGQPDCGPRVTRQGPKTPAGPGVCTTDGDTTALVGNARDLHYVIGHGALDQRVPATNFLQHLQALDAAAVEYDAEVRPAEDHLGYAVKDQFGSLVARLDERRRVRAPGTVDYAFRPALVDRALRVGPDGAHWLTSVTAASSAPGTVARAVVTSGALPEAERRTARTVGADLLSAPSPATTVVARRVPGAAAPRESALTLRLQGVRALTVDGPRAGLRRGEAVQVRATSDGPTVLTVTGLRPGTVVGGAVAGADGRAVLRIGR